MSDTPHLFIAGFGYSARAFAARALDAGWQVSGTTRSTDKADAIRQTGATSVIWDEETDLAPHLAQATHLLVSAGPDEDGDPTLRAARDAITAQAGSLRWAGYLSTTGVYGDHGGDWVDETTPLDAGTRRGQRRVEAEAAWQAIPDLPLHIFRLAGIYGPGRGPFEKVRSGRARRIIKDGQVFSRCHVDDIAQVLWASANAPKPGAIYNICDDDPAPPQDVIAYAAELLDLPLPPEVAFENADMSPMARSFYAESKRVRNDRVKRDLGIEWHYPTYREGLRALLADEA